MGCTTCRVYSWIVAYKYVMLSKSHMRLTPLESWNRADKIAIADVEIFPAFNYGRDSHETTLLQETHSPQHKESKIGTFHSKDVKLQLDVAVDMGDGHNCGQMTFEKVKKDGMLGEGIVSHFTLRAGQSVSFVLRNDIPNHITEVITDAVVDSQQHDTQTFWYNFISQSKYKGRWREVVSRSLMILKLLTYGNSHYKNRDT